MESSSPVRIGIVLAGGSGERFWPLSRRMRPKQLLDLDGSGRSLLRQAVDRLKPVVGAENLFISTGAVLEPVVREALPDLPPENVLSEPCARNTAGALIYAAARLLALHGEGQAANLTLAIVTADQKIVEEEEFRRMVRTALHAAERSDALVVCGITPTAPDTGYGYVEAGEVLPVAGEPESAPVYAVNAFHEKPDAARARAFLDSGRYYWNSGMFFWKLSAFMEHLGRAKPAMAAAARHMGALLRDHRTEEAHACFSSLESISIDYALMEKAKGILMVRGSFSWKDLGAWNTVAEEREKDGMGNVALGDPILLDCRDCVVWNEAGQDKIALGVLGLSDVVLVATEDAVLAVPRSRSQEVRKILEELKKRGAPQV